LRVKRNDCQRLGISSDTAKNVQKACGHCLQNACLQTSQYVRLLCPNSPEGATAVIPCPQASRAVGYCKRIFATLLRGSFPLHDTSMTKDSGGLMLIPLAR
jgi:hypothetical protein